MHDDEVRDHRLERRVRRRQALGVRLAEVEPGMACPGKRDHRVGNVEADDLGAPRRRGSSDVSGARGHVEHAISVADVRRIEQRVDQPGCHPPEELVVAPGLPLPLGSLEGPERINVHRRGHG
jgi:hypothetical protein